MDFVSGRDAPYIINEYIIKELKVIEFGQESTTIASEEYKRDLNFFEWMTEIVKNVSKLIF